MTGRPNRGGHSQPGAIIGAVSQQGTITDLKSENVALSDTKSGLENDKASLSDERDQLTQERDALQKQVDDREAQRAADDAAVARIAAEKDKAERDRIAAEQKKAADDAAAAQAAADQAAADAAAAAAARNTIGGDGIFAIGSEKAPGRYRTAGPSRGNCYYAVLRAPNGEGVENIIDNNNVSGPAIVDLRSGQFFESSGCEDWTRA